MKSPAELAQRLCKQWQQADQRELRLLRQDAWPICLNIGKPSAKQFKHSPQLLRQHLANWQQIKAGHVGYQAIQYQSADEPVNLPTTWQLNQPQDWVNACHNTQIEQEYGLYQRLLSHTNSLFHYTLVRQKHRVLNTHIDILVQACHVTMQLEPDMAQGKPLRAISIQGMHSKFLEQNRRLIMRLLACRFTDNDLSQGLENFLGALLESDHWLLVAPLDNNLYGFKQIRLNSSELANTHLPANNILIIENERCLHQLPALPNTLAILGAGLDLKWLGNPDLNHKNLAYWGDMDTWGLHMLAIARQHQPQLTPLLMQHDLFNSLNKQHAVIEATLAPLPHTGLTPDEQAFFHYLTKIDKGRLEQEFIPKKMVHEAMKIWITRKGI